MKRKQSYTHQQANTQTPIQAFTESKKEKTMNYIRTSFTTLVASLILLLAACSQAPAPQIEEPNLSAQAITVIHDQVSCEEAGGEYESDPLGHSSICRFNSSYTVAAGDTLELSMRGVSFDFVNLTNNGTLKILANTRMSDLINTGTVELNGGRLRLSHGNSSNTGTIHINSFSLLDLFIQLNFSNEGTINVRGTLTNYTVSLTNNGSINLECGSIFVNNGTYTGTPPRDVCSPSVNVSQATDQADPTSANSINFTAIFSEAVSGFESADVSLAGTAGATTAP